jgi:hypothetical protein
LLAAGSLFAQTSTQISGPAIPMRQESHHHLIFQNSYVNVFFVEIPPHESTLPHHHDLPYVSIQPGGADAMPGAAGSPRIGFSPGNFSHAVTNSRDVTLKNIAVELVRPQGTVRDRCAAIISGQTPDTCQEGPASATHPAKRTPLLESDEILVESWELAPGATTPPLNDPHDMLIGGLIGVGVTGTAGLDSVNALRGGILWVPAGSTPVFRTQPDRGGQFVSITFKDSGAATP